MDKNNNELTIQNTLLDHIRKLLSTHWRVAKDSADDEGKFSIGVRRIRISGFICKNGYFPTS